MSVKNKTRNRDRFWNESDDPTDTGTITTEYDTAGKAAYEGYNRALGVHDEVGWEDLIWATRHAWCEAARAARNITE